MERERESHLFEGCLLRREGESGEGSKRLWHESEMSPRDSTTLYSWETLLGEKYGRSEVPTRTRKDDDKREKEKAK